MDGAELTADAILLVLAASPTGTTSLAALRDHFTVDRAGAPGAPPWSAGRSPSAHTKRPRNLAASRSPVPGARDKP
jgi:hypothetical protein